MNPSVASQRDRVFYGSIAIALALTVFVGFGPTYYFRLITGSPSSTLTGGPVRPLVHVHAALFSLWVLLFIAQTTLVAQRKIAAHRRLGIAGATKIGKSATRVNIRTLSTVRGGTIADPGWSRQREQSAR